MGIFSQLDVLVMLDGCWIDRIDSDWFIYPLLVTSTLSLNSGIFALIALVIINVVAVRSFGELESLFSTIEIFGILLFILLGIGVCFLYLESPIVVRESDRSKPFFHLD